MSSITSKFKQLGASLIYLVTFSSLKKQLCGLAKRQVDEKTLLQGNPVLVEKMLDNVFRCQPAFESDVTKSLSAMADATTKTVEKIETSIRFSNCDDENAVEAIVDLVTYATGNNVIVIT